MADTQLDTHPNEEFIDNQEEIVVAADELGLEADNAIDSISNPIPYAFAKKHNVLVQVINQEQTQVTCFETPKLPVLTELKRRLDTRLVLNKVSSAKFDEMLRSAYDKGGSPSDPTHGRYG